MRGFVQGVDRQQTTLLPECLDDWVDEGNSIRAVDVFVDALELRDLGFDGVDPASTGRPAYHPSPILKLYIYGYLNRVQSSRRLEREAGRNGLRAGFGDFGGRKFHEGGQNLCAEVLDGRPSCASQGCTTGSSRMRAMRKLPVVSFCRSRPILIFENRLDFFPKSEA
jgi:hypothetical protein